MMQETAPAPPARKIGPLEAKVWAAFGWFLQSKPLTKKSSLHAAVCLTFLVCISMQSQAIRWSIPSMQAAGLQCSSCGNSTFSTYDTCVAQCLPLTDLQMGILSGPAFSVSTMVASVPMGWLADNSARVRLVWVLMLAWSFGALAASQADEFFQLCCAFVLVGVAQACVNPCAYSLIADYFPPASRATAVSAFSAVIFVGYDVGLLSGVVTQFWSWQGAFLLLSVPGVLLFIPVLLMREPKRGLSEFVAEEKVNPMAMTSLTSDFMDKDDLDSDEEEEGTAEEEKEDGDTSPPMGLKERIKAVLGLPVFWLLWVSATIRLCGGFALGAWLPTFYRRVFAVEPWQISLGLATVLTIGGIAGSFLGGFSADKLSQRFAAGKLWLVIGSTLLSVPFMVAMLLSRSYYVSMGCLLLTSLFGEMWFGPSIATVQDLVHPQVRSLASAIYLFGVGFGGLSPVAVALLTQWLAVEAPYSTTDKEAYDPTYSMLIVILAAYLLCSVGYACTALLLTRKRREERQEEDDEAMHHTIPLATVDWNSDEDNNWEF